MPGTPWSLSTDATVQWLPGSVHTARWSVTSSQHCVKDLPLVQDFSYLVSIHHGSVHSTKPGHRHTRISCCKIEEAGLLGGLGDIGSNFQVLRSWWLQISCSGEWYKFGDYLAMFSPLYDSACEDCLGLWHQGAVLGQLNYTMLPVTSLNFLSCFSSLFL